MREAIPALIAAVHSNHDFYVVAAAIEALGEIGDRSVIKVIQELLQQNHPLPVREAAERVFRKLQST